MSELFREIEEDIKRERFEKIWRNVIYWVIWGSVAVVALTAILVALDNYERSQAEAKTSILLRGTERLTLKDYKEAIPLFSELTDDEASSYYPVAMLLKAEAKQLSGDAEGAGKIYKQLSKLQDVFGDLSRLKTEDATSESGPADNKIFHYSYLEKRAWNALADNHKEEAAKLFSELVNDKQTPRSLAFRAGEVLRVIAPEKLRKTNLKEGNNG